MSNKRNYLITAILLVMLVAGGLYATGNIPLGGDVDEAETTSCRTVEHELVTEICGTDEEIEAVMAELGLVSGPKAGDVTVSVSLDGVTLTGTMDDVNDFLGNEEEADDDEVIETTNADDDGVVELDFSSFPASVRPYRTTFDHEQTTHIVGTEFMLGDPGVYGVLDLEDVTNDSAVLMDSDTKYVLTTSTETINLPEDGYLFVSGAGFTMNVCDRYTMEFPDFSEYNHEWQVVVRGRNWVDGIDGNCGITFSDYNDGFVQVQRFPVMRGANGFFSAEYVQQQVDHAVSDEGNRGFETNTVSLFTLDVNDGAWALNWFTDGEWGLFGTNVNYGIYR